MRLVCTVQWEEGEINSPSTLLWKGDIYVWITINIYKKVEKYIKMIYYEDNKYICVFYK